MTDDLVFYTHPYSRGRTVRWMLEELGAPYETEIIAYGDAMKSAAYRAVNPMGKVPALRHGAAVVTEAAAICAYLADAFPAAGLAPPPQSLARAPYLRWLFFAAGPLEAAATNRAFGFETPPERERSLGYGNLETALDALEVGVTGGDHLAGDAFSAADLYVAAMLGWLLQFDMIEARPAFLRYAERHNGRPAARRAREIDDALAAADG